MKKISKDQKESITIVSSSIVTGNNLLYLSKMLRDYEKNLSKNIFSLSQIELVPNRHFKYFCVMQQSKIVSRSPQPLKL